MRLELSIAVHLLEIIRLAPLCWTAAQLTGAHLRIMAPDCLSSFGLG